MGVPRPAFSRRSKHTYILHIPVVPGRRLEEEEEEEPPCYCHVTAVKRASGRAGGRTDGFMDEGLIWFMPPISFLVARRPGFFSLHGILHSTYE